MAKGYNRYNFLIRVKEIVEYFLELEAQGMTFTQIHKDYIYPRYFISRATLYNYLATPYTRDLGKFEKETEEDKKQLKLFDE